jgi:lipopolysaccharide transport system ATP-binding protein
MPEPIIKVRNLSKSYTISHQLPYTTLRDTMVDLVKKPFRFFRPKEKTELLWALDNVNFDVYPGETIGLIGPNGSGKSTLLKTLSQITAPTKGEITLHGHVASLLEIGTGFHSELTGRENIYLNGAILGMSKKEIESKFDQIVKFSGVEKFLDTPVKRYSSGMQVRLGFSVAAYLEPDILIVDEVLAVGDAEFQKKSLGKMGEVTKQAGRTIIFVSHNMDAIRRLCKKCILLRNGKVEMFDETEKVVHAYLQGENQTAAISLRDRKDRQGKGGVTFTDLKITNTDGQEKITSGDKLRFVLQYESVFHEPIEDVRVVIAIVNDDLRPVLWLDNEVCQDSFSTVAPSGQIICQTNEVNLSQGRYFVHVNFHIKGESRDLILMAATLDIATDPNRYDFKIDPNNSVCDYLIPYQFSQPKPTQ